MSELGSVPYNEHEHDFVNRSTEDLQEEISRLAISREFAAGGPRREQIERTMTNIAFELAERIRESKDIEIEEAWRHRDDVVARLERND